MLNNSLQQPEHYFSPVEVEQLAGIAAHNVRRWTRYHKEHLSPSANPEPGQPRRFTRRDVEVLRQPKQCTIGG
jgi:DNA-binding transcriptional MerR regulator